MGLLDGILSTAASLEMDPLDLATIISYETAGTFDPAKRGPTTQWGQHRGLIQFGEPQAKQYGVDWDDPLGSQLGPDGAVANYFKANGWKPGMGMLDAYSIVNAGGPGLYNRSDANNGGAPGTVKDKVTNQMSGHRAKAQALLGNDEQQIADGAMRAIGKDPIRQTSTAIGGQGADTMQQSTGLLGQLARPEDKVGGLLGMMFKNMTPDRADQIRAGLSGLQGIENQGVYNAATQRMGDRKAQRREDTLLQRQQAEKQAAEAKAAQARAQQRAWIAQNKPDLLGAFDAGLVGGSDAFEAAQPAETNWDVVEAPDGTKWQVDPKGNQPPRQLFDGVDAKPDGKAGSESRKEFASLPVVKDFASQAQAFGRIVASTKNPTAAGDMALIFNYMKLLDPGSVVRESEFEMAASSGSYGDRIAGLVARVQNGERLADSVRDDFLKRSEMLYSEAERGFESIYGQYSDNANAQGLTTAEGVTDFRYKGQNAPEASKRPQGRKSGAVAPADLPPTPDGYTLEQWVKAYNMMTPEQRKLFQ